MLNVNKWKQFMNEKSNRKPFQWRQFDSIAGNLTLEAFDVDTILYVIKCKISCLFSMNKEREDRYENKTLP